MRLLDRKINARKRKNKRPNQAELHFESLEPKQMLTGLTPLTNGASDAISIPTPQIVAGTDPDAIVDPNVSTSAFTGSVSLRPGGGTCSGTLISDTHVLTAAHCVVDDNGFPLTTNEDFDVRFNHDEFGEWHFGISAAFVHPDYNPAVGGYDDLAILELSRPAPTGAEIYPISTGSFTEGQTLVFAGYGLSGTGSAGSNVGTSYFVKRTGRNVVSGDDGPINSVISNPLDDEGSGRRELYYYDFDGGGIDFLGDGGSLGNNIEGNQSGGDSGGSVFTWSDDGDGVVESGELTLYGAHSGSFSDDTDGRFGEVSYGVFLSSYATWISSIVETDTLFDPTPVTAGVTNGSLLTGGDSDFYSFSAVEGESYAIETELVSLFDSTLILYENGDPGILVPGQIDDNDDIDLFAGNRASRILFTAPETGEYIVEVDNFSNSDSGSYRLTIEDTDSPTSPRPVEVGSSARGQILTFSDIDYLSFEAEFGQTYTIETGSLDFSLIGIPGIPALSSSLVDLVYQTEDGIRESLIGSRIDDGESLTWTSDFSGTVTIEIRGGGGDLGAYQVEINEDDHSNVIRFAESVRNEDELVGALQFSDDQDVFRFSADAGISYQFTEFADLVSDSLVSLEVFDSSGRFLESSIEVPVDFTDPFSPFLGSVLNFFPAESGDYFLRVRSPFGGQTNYQIFTDIFDDHADFSSTFADELVVGGIASGALSGSLDQDFFQFTPTVGQTYDLRVGITGFDVGSPSLQVFDPNNNEVAFQPFVSGEQTTVTWTPTDSGTYFIAIGGEDDAIGEYDLQITSGLGQFVTSVVRDEGGTLERPDLLSTYAVSFNVDVNVSVDDLIIRNDTLGGTVVDTTGLTLSFDSETNTAEWDFGGFTLDPAFYSFELSSDIVSGGDNVGVAFIESVYVALPGDANLDGQVNVLDDGFALVENLGTTGGVTWSEGDFNGDGDVDVLGDAFALVGSLGQSVVPTVEADFGLAFDFSGFSRDFIQVGDRPELRFSDNFTIEARVNPDFVDPSLSDLSDPSGIIVNKEGEYELAIWGDGSLRYAIANNDPGWVWINTGIIVPQNQWSHISFSYQDGLVRAYLNGELEYTDSGEGLVGDVLPELNDFRIGGRQGFVQFFDGGLDEIRVWDRVLTDVEIANGVSSPLEGNELGLAAYYSFESSDPLQDFSVNDLDGAFAAFEPEHLPFDNNRFSGLFA